MVLLDEMLFPAGAPRFGRERITTEMTNLLLHGALHREEPAKAADEPN
jgi:hypothetical protein